MPTAIFRTQKSVDRFSAALVESGGSVSRVVEVRPFWAVKYKLPKATKSEKHKLLKAPKPRREP